MLFTLEALDASEGDCLLLLYGTARQPRLVVIDGGPRSTCDAALLPRLLALRSAFPADAPLPVELLVVTHVDSDHIAGVVALTGRLLELRAAGAEPPLVIKELWHNSFDGVLGEQQVRRAIDFVNRLSEAETSADVVASASEGRKLHDDAVALGMAINAEFADLVARADDGGVQVPCGDGLTLTVLGPARQQLDDFRREWDATLGKQASAHGQVAATPDTSRPNLASIVLLAECRGRSMLLAGDARGDHILAGLEAAGKLPPGGTMHIDVFKLPHHGSCRNNSEELLQRVTADTYVISANGKHANPDRETLERLAVARGVTQYTVVCTFPEAAYKLVKPDAAGAEERREALLGFHEWAQRQTARGVTIRYREASALSLAIELGDEEL
ncbi:hypothetical protein [Nannocystis sp.]|uniref:hypothetical protein n=1 Tax=Nannocystis sp. TaxID=1962667 RepID=UPI0025DDB520|nr:hypothetical protein [Nannocystis sp.]MBK7827140.1 MBL fold metallo-hydrolase [Nannocystis sp.]